MSLSQLKRALRSLKFKPKIIMAQHANFFSQFETSNTKIQFYSCRYLVLCGILFGKGKSRKKWEIIYNLYDAEANDVISRDDLKIMIDEIILLSAEKIVLGAVDGLSFTIEEAKCYSKYLMNSKNLLIQGTIKRIFKTDEELISKKRFIKKANKNYYMLRLLSADGIRESLKIESENQKESNKAQNKDKLFNFTRKCLLCNLEIGHSLAKRIYLLNAKLVKDTFLKNIDQSEYLVKLSNDFEENFWNFVWESDENFQKIKCSLEKAFEILTNNPTLTKLLNDMEQFLDSSDKFIIFTHGIGVETILDSTYIDKILENEEFEKLLNIKGKVIQITINFDCFVNSWIYTIKALKYMKFKHSDEIKLLPWYLCVPTTQPSFMVIVHELLHVLRFLKDSYKVKEDDEENTHLLYSWPIENCFWNDKLFNKKIEELKKIWTNKEEVDVIIGLKSNKDLSECELYIRKQLNLPIRIYHLGGIGQPDPLKCIMESSFLIEDALKLIYIDSELDELKANLLNVQPSIEEEYSALSRLYNFFTNSKWNTISDIYSQNSSFINISSSGCSSSDSGLN